METSDEKPLKEEDQKQETISEHKQNPLLSNKAEDVALHVKLPVSLAFKRTCYKCGNLGHYAEECPSTERLCYNCKQAGHESTKCPNARTSESKQCYFCKEIGHIQSECTKYNFSGQSQEQYPLIGPQHSKGFITRQNGGYQAQSFNKDRKSVV